MTDLLLYFHLHLGTLVLQVLGLAANQVKIGHCVKIIWLFLWQSLETWDMCSFWEIVLLSQDFRINSCFIVQQQLIMWANFVSVCVVVSPAPGKDKSHNRKRGFFCREASQVLTTTQDATAAIFSTHPCIFFSCFLCIKDNLFMMKSAVNPFPV